IGFLLAGFVGFTTLNANPKSLELNSLMGGNSSMITTRLTLNRSRANSEAIIGELYINGRFECYTLEDATYTITPGTYDVILHKSPHFHGQYVLLLRGVKGRTGIEIHVGNF